MNKQQHPTIKLLRNIVQAYIGERDNAGLPVSTLIVSDFTRYHVGAIQAANPRRPFGWAVSWSGAYLRFADEGPFISNGKRVRGSTWPTMLVEAIGADRDHRTGDRGEPDELRMRFCFWNGGETLVECKSARELAELMRTVEDRADADQLSELRRG